MGGGNNCFLFSINGFRMGSIPIRCTKASTELATITYDNKRRQQ